MPSEMMQPKGLSSSSFFSEDVCFPNERQIGFWKTETMPDHYVDSVVKMDGVIGTTGGNSVVSSPLEKQMSVESQMVKSFKLPDQYLIRDRKVNLTLEKHAVGAEREASRSLRRPVDHDPAARSNLKMEPATYFMEGEGINAMGTHYENGLFSSSLSELFGRKLRLTSNNGLYGHSVGGAASHYEEEEPFQSLEEIEAQTIGNLLPNDDDLLSGVTDGLDYVAQPNIGDDIEDLDFFSSVGGLDLGEDGFLPGQRDSEFSGGSPDNQMGGSFSSVAGEHTYGEHPSRTLFVQNINSNVEDSELQALFEQYGDVRTLYTACKNRGFVMISYYDIRAAQNAMRALQNKPLKRRKLDIHFSIPKDNASQKDINQGTLVVFNHDSSVSNEELWQIFGAYGEIKEIRETPHRSHHKFIEFYDVRAAEAALHALNRSDIAGKRIKLEPIHPGGARRWQMERLISVCVEATVASCRCPLLPLATATPSLLGAASTFCLSLATSCCIWMQSSLMPPFPSEIEQDESGPYLQQISSPNNSTMRFSGPISHGGITSSGMDNGTISGDGLTNRASCNSPGMAANISASPSERIENRQFCRVSSNGHPLELNDAVFGSSRNGSCSPGHHYIWSNSNNPPQPQGMMWPNGVCTTHPPPRLHAFPRAPSHMMNTLLPMNNHHVGSAPSVNPSLWERRHTYSGESPDASGFHRGSLGNMRISGNSLHHLEFIPQNMFPSVGGNCMDLPIPSQNVGLHSPHQGCLMFPGGGQMIPMMSPFDSPNERARSHRNEGNSNQADNKKQFELDIDRIMRGEDNRTTLMIKNIPNKKFTVIDENSTGYPMLYTTWQLANKCNVGYAFINMTNPSLIVPFYQAFDGKKWEKFNSEKVASLAYARIQGKAALIAHFQNSSLMNEDKRCRPILFNTDGPNVGDQVPFPMGVNVRSRPSKTRGITSEENHQETSPNLANGEESFNGDSSSKDSD
ncbi:hypothetical protein TEA_024688 [Camellia sinensis var. sinensis]|uniref:RRM domain-containing protein n=1 Tax=Camellia sinensis var. sinensis TaxID=542762 RepID=A0A4S4ETC2_CAMSN|nr:hypothetical protein TEA_024688 [Camellia sinensis var. sinensis]